MDAEITQELVAHLAPITEIDTAVRRRAEYSSDASNYRVVPAAVAFPHDADETAAILEVARNLSVPVTSRGAGTSVAGNAIGPGLVLDFSRHMNRILDIDAEAGLARVQPGVIMTDLQKAASPTGLWFGPDPSTKNRATIGGMIGNNACGPHALAFGRTADNVDSLEIIDGTGRRFTAGTDLSVVPGLSHLVSSNLALIRTVLGCFTRQVSGYSLEHLLPENGTHLAKALVGTEGTVATLVEATVNLRPMPQTPVLVVLGYADMPSAADDVSNLLGLNLLAVEGMDSRLVEVVRRHRGSVPDLPRGAGWLFCETEGVDAARELISTSACMDSRIVADKSESAALWQIRADGVGLAGRTPSGKAAWPGWEDSAVPPEHLGTYLREFDVLMDAHGVYGLPYGHFGDGCIHIRIDWPLDNPGDIPAFGTFMEEAADLVSQFGGSLSGEHGDGRARSSLLPRMYSQEVLDLFGNFKALFDPKNLLNPGVLVDPKPLTEDLRRPAARTLGAQGFSFREDGGDMTRAVHRCTGVGKCRANNFVNSGFMCPSYQASKDEKDVTRARARMLQEVANGSLVGGWDSPALAESLDLCLSCKACGHDCPAGVDIARYKSEATYRKYRGKLRPPNHYVLGWLPRWARLATMAAPIAAIGNAAMNITPIRKAVFSLSGIDSRRTMTAFATQRFSRWFKKKPSTTQQGQDVIVWADSFSEYLDPTSAKAMVDLLVEAGYRVRIPSSPACCGLTWISTGQLDGAKKRLRGLLDVLGPAAEEGVPIVGIEPSCTAVLRDDLVDLLPDDPRSHAVASQVFTLAELLTHPEFGPGPQWKPATDLSGVTIIAQPHCHQHSVMGFGADAALLRRLGADVQQLSGCCGLAGNFGMEKGHYETSVAVAENGLLPALREMPENAMFLADGYSCRTQALQLAGVEGVSLPQLLGLTRP
ncbi:FAD-binding protein [Actinomycetaceae bacterium WB03_NA08]|uniref:FAD-binding protein n=1 Tax=Scrofimicrobium canadense TaxID=2652290 RepID=A0A6N7VND1_9ACTO|nr:FAD-linked oxidase C-terminal domain-containing protein [Scrofimicrobium canadense]MSS83214.1 FAD-binding protein [Scrofimicrobium canadense]